MLAHPDGGLDVRAIATIAGGPALYLIGNLMFKHVMGGGFALSHIVGLILLALLVPIAAVFSLLAFGTAVALILVIVAVWETRRWLGAGDTEAAAAKLASAEPGDS